MEAIAYERNGRMFIRTNVGLDEKIVNKLQHDIDDVLKLNGYWKKDGTIWYDTTSHIVTRRKRISDSTCTQFERWDRQGKLTVTYLLEQIEKLEKQLTGDEIAEPFVGVRLFFFRKKLRELERRNKK